MAQIPVWEKAIFLCLLSLQKSSLGSLSCMVKVHPLHTGVGSTMPCLPNSSVFFVCHCGSVRHDKQGNYSNLWGWWADFTAFLWLGAMTVKTRALGGVFDVFVLFRAGSGSPLHALMSCWDVWCWPSNLLWCSGPGVHPSILPLSHTQMRSLHTQSTSHAQADTHSFTLTVGNALLRLPAALCWWLNEEGCAPVFVFYVCMKEGEVETECVTSLCVYSHIYVYVD